MSYLGKFAQFGFHRCRFWWSYDQDFLFEKRHFFILRLFRTHCKYPLIFLPLESESHQFLVIHWPHSPSCAGRNIFKHFRRRPILLHSHGAQSNCSFGLWQQKFPPGLSTKLSKSKNKHVNRYCHGVRLCGKICLLSIFTFL